MSLKKQAANVRAAGYKNSGQDSMLAHITPEEALKLKMMGGSGRTDPHTGLPHFDENGDGGMGGSMGSGTADGGFDGSSGGYDGGMGAAAADAGGYDGSVGGFAGLDSAAGYDGGLAGLDSGYDGLGSMGFNAAKDSQAANVDGGFGVNSDFNGSVNTGVAADDTGFSLSNLLGVLGHLPGLPGFAAKATNAATATNPGKSMGNMMGSIAGGLMGGIVGGPPGAMAGSALGGKMGNGLSGMGAKDANGNPDSSGTASAGPGNFSAPGNSLAFPTAGVGSNTSNGFKSMLPGLGIAGAMAGLGGLFNSSQTPTQNYAQSAQGDGGGGDTGAGGDSGPNGTTPGMSNGATVGADRSGFDFGSLTSLLPGLAGIYSSNQAQGNAQGVTNQATRTQDFANSQAESLANMYGPNSPYAAQLREQLGRKDAASGRNSQYGPREVELQARLADAATKNAPNVLAATKEALAASGKGYDARQYGTAAQGQTLSKLLAMANQTGLTKAAGKGLAGLFSGMGGLSMGGGSGNSVGGLAELESAAANSGGAWPSADAAASYGSANNNSGGGDNFWDSWF